MVTSRRRFVIGSVTLVAICAGACDRREASSSSQPSSSQPPAATAGGGGMTVGVAFPTLKTEAWVYSFDLLKQKLAERDVKVVDAVADDDSSKQFEQVRNFIARKVDGIIIVPTDSQTVLPIIKSANRANIPIVLYNRPPADPNAKCVTVVADNVAITRETVKYMCEQAKKTGRKHKAMILIGDLGDTNAVGRRDGFEAAVKEYADVIEVVARVPTEWNGDKALAGVNSALQSHPDISFIFTSSDFMLPQIVSALKGRGKYRKVGEEGHVILGGFDGDQTAYQMILDGYLDADGVQDMTFESEQAVQAVLDMKAGRQVPPVIQDTGFVAHQRNRDEIEKRMWGAAVARKKAGGSPAVTAR